MGPRAVLITYAVGFICRNASALKQVRRFRQQWAVDRHVVGDIQQLRELDALDARPREPLGRDVRIERDDPEAERLRLRRDQLRNSAEADQPEDGARRR